MEFTFLRAVNDFSSLQNQDKFSAFFSLEPTINPFMLNVAIFKSLCEIIYVT